MDPLTKLYIYHSSSATELPEMVQALPIFVLSTCQRQIMASLTPLPWALNHWEEYCGNEAYHFLLEVVCGLHSKLLGETEILAQFKLAFQSYLASDHAQMEIVRVFEKILKDAKEIRTRHLIGIGKNSYGGLIRKLLQKHQGSPVLITGSGDLAYQVVTNLKKFHPVKILARNTEKVKILQNKFQVETLRWNDFPQWHKAPLVVNTIGTEGILFTQQHFSQWADHHQHPNRCFIDLGAPSPLDPSWRNEEGVLRLNELLDMVKHLTQEKQKKITQAKAMALELANRREHFFSSPKVPIEPHMRYL